MDAVSTLKTGNRSLPFSCSSSGLFQRSKLTVVNLIDYFSVKIIGQRRRKKLANSVPSTLFEHRISVTAQCMGQVLDSG